MDSPSSSSSYFSLITLFFSLTTLFLLSCCADAQKNKPAMYVIGDSLMDVGNNNYLTTVLRADFAHNGIDFPGGKATGRFTNGKNAADFFGELLGFPAPSPYLAVHSGSRATDAFIRGVNFASGGAGLLRSTNENLCISMNKQIDYLGRVYEAIAEARGEGRAKEHLSGSVFVVNIGSNDIFRYIKLAIRPTPQQYVDSMTASLQKNLKRMYSLGVRKLMVIGLAPVGCCPFQRNKRGECNEVANHLANLFNKDASSLLRDMTPTHTDLNYSFFNTSFFMDIIQDPAPYGFSNVKAACCGEVGDLGIVPCTPLARCCSNRKGYLFWDYAHPTEAAIKVMAGVAVDGSSPYVHPVNLRQLFLS